MARTLVEMDSRALSHAIDSLNRDAPGAVEAALQAGGRVLENAWEDNIVSMDIVETGTYLKSVHTEVTGPLEVTVGTDILDPPYPAFQEFGTSRIPARPAARNAFDTHHMDAVDEVVDAIKDLFRQHTR